MDDHNLHLAWRILFSTYTVSTKSRSGGHQCCKTWEDVKAMKRIMLLKDSAGKETIDLSKSFSTISTDILLGLVKVAQNCLIVVIVFFPRRMYPVDILINSKPRSELVPCCSNDCVSNPYYAAQGIRKTTLLYPLHRNRILRALSFLAASNPRAARAGLLTPGKPFCLYTKSSYMKEIQEATAPAIKRANLANVVLGAYCFSSLIHYNPFCAFMFFIPLPI
ncbi:hypothetical protein O181_105793 [Austropuccinia psidii MF-1]|uniref:Uncharacterized protein n=1 Tax=Austropuccinia psidii MF-1 TaxID=1389203 RepID=A0A9Q3JMQ8_9BASI|nr:hypothetical protein [Austropuccinia psidii MF-1]